MSVLSTGMRSFAQEFLVAVRSNACYSQKVVTGQESSESLRWPELTD